MVSTCFWWTPFQAPCRGSPVPGQRRSYPKSFKAQIVEECTQPGASVAGVALSHGLNANLVHKWSKRLANTPPRSLLLAAWCPPVFGGH
ncbi:transposase, partial [Pseudomonas aeruginosa]|nr:transposase [Pseudomonas aeruginosa]